MTNHGSADPQFWGIAPAVQLQASNTLEVVYIEAELSHIKTRPHLVAHAIKLVYSVGEENVELFPKSGRQSKTLSVRCAAPNG